MKVGDLVKWTISWIAARARINAYPPIDYSSMIGIVVDPFDGGAVIRWSDGQERTVHHEFVEVVCK